MSVEQITISLKDKTGGLTTIAQILAANGINILTLSLADREDDDLGTLRLIVNDTEMAEQLLQENGYQTSSTNVLILKVPDKPGGLASVLTALHDSNMSIKYVYAFSQRRGESGLIIFRIDNPDKAETILGNAGIDVLCSEEVYAL